MIDQTKTLQAMAKRLDGHSVAGVLYSATLQAMLRDGGVELLCPWSTMADKPKAPSFGDIWRRALTTIGLREDECSVTLYHNNVPIPYILRAKGESLPKRRGA